MADSLTPINGILFNTPLRGALFSTPLRGALFSTPLRGALFSTPLRGALFNTPLKGVSKFKRLFPAGKTQEIISYLLTVFSLNFCVHPRPKRKTYTINIYLVLPEHLFRLWAESSRNHRLFSGKAH